MENFNIEELKTTIGCIMLDLRGNWGWDYEKRIEIIQKCLEKLLKEKPENEDFKSDLELCESAIDEGEYRDGRVFRDCGILYGYSSEEGKTVRVWEFLQQCLTYPDSNNFKINNDQPIQTKALLSQVLLALSKNQKIMQIISQESGKLDICPYQNDWFSWDLQIDFLENQPEQTQTAINQLLTK